MSTNLIRSSNQISWESFIDTRGKIENNSGDKLSAWVVNFTEKGLIIQSSAPPKIIERFLAQNLKITLNEVKQSAQFHGKISGKRGDQFQIEYSSIIAINKPTEKMRRLAKHIEATLIVKDESYQGFLIDYSQYGAGMTCLHSFDPGTIGTVCFKSKNGEISVDGALVYCVFLSEQKGFRMGINFGDSVPRNITQRILDL